MGMIIGPDAENGVVDGVKSKMDTGNSYKLDFFIPDKDHAENLFSCNFADVLANLFDDLSPISIDCYFFLAFLVFSSYFSKSNGISDYKPLNSISSGSPATYNPGNILALYNLLFAFLIVRPSTNIVSTDFSHSSSNSIEIECRNYISCLLAVVSAFFGTQTYAAATITAF